MGGRAAEASVPDGSPPHLAHDAAAVYLRERSPLGAGDCVSTLGTAAALHPRAKASTSHPPGVSHLPDKVASHDGQVVAITLHRFAGPSSIAWAISQMQWAKRPLASEPSIGFHKLMGTGGGAGFSTKPNFRVWSILSTWSNGAAAARTLSSPLFEERSRRAAETATFYLAPITSRGRWAGKTAFELAEDACLPEGEPIAALTRATVRPSKLARFWRRVPAISETVEGEPAVRFMIGMGEVPYLHQVTFSVWDDAESMSRFSRESATHGEAVRRVAEEGWFSEQLFARFRVLGAVGTWNDATATQLIGANQ